jgi:ATP-dependent exoDNAse (exonuclease V) beta subunit
LEITRIEPANEDGVNGFGVSLNYGPTLFMPESWQMAKAKMRHYANDANWKAYFHIKDNWLDLRPLHALTCHKSQGSTYKEVFIDMADIGENKKWEEIARLMYVAVSRASAAVYLYGSLKMRNWRNTSCAIQ